jgi:hypothetical protein
LCQEEEETNKESAEKDTKEGESTVTKLNCVCPLCDQAAKTIHHLMMECPFTRQIWHKTIAWLRIPCLPPEGEDTLTDWWRSVRRHTPKQMHKGLACGLHRPPRTLDGVEAS